MSDLLSTELLEVYALGAFVSALGLLAGYALARLIFRAGRSITRNANLSRNKKQWNHNHINTNLKTHSL